MKLNHYELKSVKNLMTFEFISEGPKGQITKLVQYSKISPKGIYNIGFGDKDFNTGGIDDTVITNNGDSRKVLTTVAATVYLFLNKYPNASIYAIGSNKARTRLYRIGITNNLSEIKNDFELYGLKDEKWEAFNKQVEYDAFLLRRKKYM